MRPKPGRRRSAAFQQPERRQRIRSPVRETWSVAEGVVAEDSEPEFDLPEGPICTGDYSPDSCWMELVDRPGMLLCESCPPGHETVTWSEGVRMALAQGNGRVSCFKTMSRVRSWRDVCRTEDATALGTEYDESAMSWGRYDTKTVGAWADSTMRLRWGSPATVAPWRDMGTESCLCSTQWRSAVKLLIGSRTDTCDVKRSATRRSGNASHRLTGLRRVWIALALLAISLVATPAAAQGDCDSRTTGTTAGGFVAASRSTGWMLGHRSCCTLPLS